MDARPTCSFDYDALSYVWGSAVNPVTFFVRPTEIPGALLTLRIQRTLPLRCVLFDTITGAVPLRELSARLDCIWHLMVPPHALPLRDLLSTASARLSTYPRDKIYGLLGLGTIASLRALKKIRPNYAYPVAIAYMEASLTIYEDMRSLALLIQCGPETSTDHALITTDLGYFGLAHTATRVGDIIGVIFGCLSPIALRPLPSAENMFRVVGSCYIHGSLTEKAS